MNGLARIVFFVVMTSAAALAADNSVVESVRAQRDVALTTDPASSFWSGAHPVFLEKDTDGRTVPGYRSEVRTRWTKDNLYFLFVCPYEELNLKPAPNTKQETNQLWNWDVAEVFIGSDFGDIKRYKEFEVSPQAEWIDLDIDLNQPHHEDGWSWNSGFKVAARIDPLSRRWYAAMRIPLPALDKRPAMAGNTLRMNLFRSQGPKANRHEVTWRPPMGPSFHAPEHFGLLKLVAE